MCEPQEAPYAFSQAAWLRRRALWLRDTQTISPNSASSLLGYGKFTSGNACLAFQSSSSVAGFCGEIGAFTLPLLRTSNPICLPQPRKNIIKI